MTRELPSPKADLSFWGHLEELRGRILKIAVFYVIACCLFYPEAQTALGYLIAPVGKLIFTSPGDAFCAFWNVVLGGGALLSVPYILYHIWSFIAEGLTEEEKKLVFFYGLLSFVLFLLGAVFAFYVIMPMALQFFLSYQTPQITAFISVDKYMSFLFSWVIDAGLAFETPLFIFVLARFGIVTPEFFAQKRRYAIVIILIIAAILTPPDVVSQILLAAPMLILYELGIIFAKMGRKK
ncbi:MAG: twin-arginine translocase subunit TatC [Candidatus Omnitrophica bacterium]|nr:twin-arginine translocase subunit TatC [Candidatus Omnitrophota bacterium]